MFNFSNGRSDFAGKNKTRYFWDRKSYSHHVELLILYFKSKMEVTEQYWVYGFMAYVAENGGFVGLFLGYSILQLNDIISYFLDTPTYMK